MFQILRSALFGYDLTHILMRTPTSSHVLCGGCALLKVCPGWVVLIVPYVMLANCIAVYFRLPAALHVLLYAVVCVPLRLPCICYVGQRLCQKTHSIMPNSSSKYTLRKVLHPCTNSNTPSGSIVYQQPKPRSRVGSFGLSWCDRFRNAVVVGYYYFFARVDTSDKYIF